MSHPDTRLHTDAIRSRLSTGSGLQVGDAEAPTNDARPYLVLFPLSPGNIEGPLNDQAADHWLEYQVTAVGDTREQAEWAQTKSRDAFLGGTNPTPPSGYAYQRDPELIPGQAVTRDDALQPPLFYAVDIYRFQVSPS